jgi:CheY-like chemotaxis protein
MFRCPIKNGYQATEEIRKINGSKNIPIIVSDSRNIVREKENAM